MMSTELIQVITLAFANLMTPSIDNLVYDNRPEHLECAEIRDRLGGKNWRDIASSIDAEHYPGDDIFFLTVDSLKALLPGYMIGTISNFRNADLVPEALVTRLNPNIYDNFSEDLENLVGLLSIEQQRAILEFLMYLNANHSENMEEDSLNDAIIFWRKQVEKVT